MSGNPVAPILPVGLQALDPVMPVAPTLSVASAGGFSRLLLDAAQGVSEKVQASDKMVHDFALDDSMPLHQVTYALEEARLSLSLMMQVRNRLVESYQQVMNMQL